MTLVYFEALNSDGSLSPHLIASEQIARVRPLSVQERDFSERLSTGFFKKFDLNSFLKATSGTSAMAASLHPSARCALQTSHVSDSLPERTYYLAQTVQQLAARLDGLRVLTGNPASPEESQPADTAGDAGPVLGQPATTASLLRFPGSRGPRRNFRDGPAPR